MKRAVISRDRAYRYFLSRGTGAGPAVTFIMLNPSTADAEIDDPTVRKCLGFCRRWGFARLHVLNLFAIRTSSPAEMKKARDPVGTENERHLRQAILGERKNRVASIERGPLICAWGVHGGYLQRDQDVMAWLSRVPAIWPMCLGLTRDGHPVHPLYVPYSAPLVPFCPESTVSTRAVE
jgi:hypothetical protein